MRQGMGKTDNDLYQKTTLKDGLRIVTIGMPSVRSISLGIWIDVGSRNEQRRESGVTHLIEHMVFKGTKNRTAKQIAASLESLGGSLNAFTSKEQTCFNARIIDEHLDVALDVLADLSCNATLTPVNLAREKQVVYEEIKECRDMPSDHINDIFATAYWGEHPLGRPILGDMETLAKMKRSSVTGYIDRNYRAGSVLVAAAGSVSHRKLVRLVKDKLSFKPGVAEPYVKAGRSTPRKILFESTKNHQVHLCLGHPGPEYAAREKLTALVIQAYLGGGMSSVLFQKIREEKGLAYTVYTFNEFYRDGGVIGTYMAADKSNLKPCLEITLRELDRMKRRRLSSEKLDQIKSQIKGQLTLGMESTYSRMNRMARLELMTGGYISLARTLEAIDKVSSSAVLDLANRMFDNSQLALAVLGAADKSVVKDVL